MEARAPGPKTATVERRGARRPASMGRTAPSLSAGKSRLAKRDKQTQVRPVGASARPLLESVPEHQAGITKFSEHEAD